jgi:hypothetical protein
MKNSIEAADHALHAKRCAIWRCAAFATGERVHPIGISGLLEVHAERASCEFASPHLGLEHIALAVDDIEAALAEMGRKNFSIVAGMTEVRPGLRTLFIGGPDGVSIDLLQRQSA